MIVDPFVPLIWTTKGNIPRAAVSQDKLWHVSEDDPNIVLKLVYRLLSDEFGAKGEIVREDVHVFVRQGVAMVGEQAKLW